MIQFNNGFIVVDKDWAGFKSIINTEKKIRAQYEMTDVAYSLYAFDDKIVYRHDILLGGKEPYDWTSEQTATNTNARSEFEQSWQTLFNKQLEPHDADGNQRVVTEPLAGSKFNVISVNWCDKCSWYETSVKVTDEVLTDSGDGLTFNSSCQSWIDMKHGRLTDEDNILTGNPNKWIVTIKSDGVSKTESPMLTTSADYQVDYPLGKVTFNSSQAGKTILATYWYGISGQFTVKPLPGKKIKILYVEVQFSKNIILNDAMVFQAYGYAGVFAPQYVPVPFAANDLIPLQAANKYKKAADFVNESNGCYPLVPGFGGTDRGLQNDVITLPWKYLTRTDLLSSAGMEIRVGMENNVPHTGELGTATFYCISETE